MEKGFFDKKEDDYNLKTRFNQLQTCLPYRNQESLYHRIIIVTLPVLFFVQILLTYKQMSRETKFLGIQSYTLNNYLEFFLNYAFGGVIILKAFTLVIILSQIMFSQQLKSYQMVEYSLNKAKVFLRLIIQTEYHLSSFLLLIPSTFVFINFMFSTTIIGFAFVFLENHYNQKDCFYNGSFSFLLIYRIILFFGSLINFVVIMSESSINILVFYHIAASAYISIIYLRSGWTTYNNKVLSWGLVIFIVLYIDLSFNIGLYQFWEVSFSAFNIQVFITFVIVLFFFFQTIKSKTRKALTRKRIFQNEVPLLFDMATQSSNLEDQMTMSAVLKSHSLEGCLNPNCYSNLHESYDNQRQTTLKHNEYTREIHSLLKLLIQCRYEKYIKSHNTDLNAILSYCQFLYWRRGNTGIAMYWLQFIKSNTHNLSLSSLIRFNGLLCIIRSQNNKNCQKLFNRKLEIEHLIDAQETYNQISKDIYSILIEKKDIWKMIDMQVVNVSKIIEVVEQAFGKTYEICQAWKSICNYLKFSNKWKDQYLFFLHFVKNERINNKLLQEFAPVNQNIIDFQDLFENQKTIFCLKSLIDVNSCCIHIFLNDGMAFMKKVCNNFTNVTGYSSVEAAKSNIDLLIPQTTKHYHYQILSKMSSEGNFSNDKIYKPYEIYFVNKEGYLVPAFKIFKEFITENSQLEYICFFKKVQQKEITILCDEYFNIKGFTRNLIEQTQINDENRKCINYLNLLSMMPNLTSRSVFRQEAQVQVVTNQNCETFQMRLRQEAQNKCFITRRLTKLSVLEKEKSIIKSSVNSQFIYSKGSLKECLSFYNFNMKSLNKANKAEYFRLIKMIEDKIKIDNTYFECQVLINEITNSYCNYYELKITNLTAKEYENTLKDISQHDQNQIINLPYNTQQVSTMKRIFSGPKAITNIFIKDNCNEAPKSNKFLRIIKVLWVFYCLQFVVSSGIKMFSIQIVYDNIENCQHNILKTFQFSIISSTLTSYYHAILLNVTTIDQIRPKILDLTNELVATINTEYLKMVIFDQSINRPTTYFPVAYNEKNTGLSYNQIDFPYFGAAMYKSISMQANITLQSNEYQQLNDYYYPSYSNFINNAKLNLQNSYQSYIYSLQRIKIIFLVVSCISFLAILILLLFYTRSFHNSIGEMMRIHCQLNTTDIQGIIEYYHKVLNIFCKMQTSNQDEKRKDEKSVDITHTKSYRSQFQSLDSKMVENKNLNKKLKVVQMGQKQSRKELFFYLKLMTCLAIIFLSTIVQNIYSSSFTRHISDLEEHPFKLFAQIPTYVDSGLIIANRHLLSNYQVDLTEYLDILTKNNITKQTPYQNTPQYGLTFYNAMKTVYFSNACQFGEEWLIEQSINKQDCNVAAQRSFQRGLRAFFAYQSNTISQIFYNKDKSLSQEEIVDYYGSIWIANVFFLGLLQVWDQEFDVLLPDFLDQIMKATCFCIVFFAIMVMVIYCGLFNKLYLDYALSRQFYRTMMPQFIVNDQKIIKSKLSVIGFL